MADINGKSTGGLASGKDRGGPGGKSGDDADFEEAGHFQGSRPGYVFKLGPKGCGYYRDRPPVTVSRSVWRLLSLTRSSKWEQAIRLLDDDPSLWHAEDEDGVTLLHWAALAGQDRVVKQALAAGVPVDSLSPETLQTPLMWAVVKGHCQVAKTLIDARADPSLRDSLGATALLLAVQYQQCGCLLLLLSGNQLGEALATADDRGCTLAHWAAWKGDLEMLKILEHFGVDFLALDKEQKTALHRAIQALPHHEQDPKRADVVEFLIAKGCNPELKDASGSSCLDLASSKEGRCAQRMRLALKNAVFDGKGDLECGSAAALVSKRHDHPEPEQMTLKDYGPAIFWVVNVSFCVLQYLTHLRDTAYALRPWCASTFELGVALSLALFVYLSRSDPGRVPASTREQAIDKLMRSLQSGSSDAAASLGRLCTTTWVVKGPRTKYCKKTGACVTEFDHWCAWLNNSIGRGNHRPFILLAAVEVTTQISHIYLMATVTREEVVAQDFLTWLFAVVVSQPLTAWCAAVQLITCPCILFLLWQQLAFVALNKTTNESINAERYGLIKEVEVKPGLFRKIFVNPYDKGGVLQNCLDFWWARRRSENGIASQAQGWRAQLL